ncbi:alpha/beta hydrolase [Ascidiaceihabitans sp.]|uniref:alpha/beta hydrolase n=1 Tax=Ascidiaceihabitans sp. TaxID=1872644 RepID=UPI0032971480
MSLSIAPLFTDVCAGPPSGAAFWVHTEDGLRLRFGAWNREGTNKGTILVFPGRTEYVEKYGPAACEFAARGYATVAIDWRGQGLADRMLDDPRIGHVGDFEDYQKDVAAIMDALDQLDLPKPYFMVGHSMGGCIGLRALYNGLDVAACAFTAPMWGIRISPFLRPLAWALGHSMPVMGQDHRIAPTTFPEPYVHIAPFEDNKLTTDPETYTRLQDQLTAHPGLALGGPSFAWLRKALFETQDLAKLPAPNLTCATFLGTNERIVHVQRIEDRMAGWENGTLVMVENGEHEVLMETPQMRASVFDGIAKTFRSVKPPAA